MSATPLFKQAEGSNQGVLVPVNRERLDVSTVVSHVPVKVVPAG